MYMHRFPEDLQSYKIVLVLMKVKSNDTTSFAIHGLENNVLHEGYKVHCKRSTKNTCTVTTVWMYYKYECLKG